MTPLDELRHLQRGAREGEQPDGIGTVNVTLTCHGDSSAVVDRARSVMITLLENAATPLASLDAWSPLLPEWFVAACGPERSLEEAQTWLSWWRSLPPDRQADAIREQRWTLADWLFWFNPDERQWFWWDAEEEGPNTAHLAVEVLGWPTPFGSLEWLLRASGAITVSHEIPDFQ